MSAGDFRVIGEPEILIAFRFVGVEGQACFERGDTLAAFRNACADGVRVLIITQDVAALVRDELTAWQLTGQCPLLVELPPLTGTVGERRSLVDMVRAAIGVHV